MATLALPAIASYNTQLWLGGPTSPPTYVLQARIGNVKFAGMTIDMVDVSNQASTAHRMLGTLLKPGDVTFDLYVEPASAQDQILIDIVITAPPALQQWKIITAAGTDGTAFLFNGYLSAFPLDASIGKALTVPCKISIDNNVTVVFGAGPL
jgi:hypothetical protein